MVDSKPTFFALNYAYTILLYYVYKQNKKFARNKMRIKESLILMQCILPVVISQTTLIKLLI